MKYFQTDFLELVLISFDSCSTFYNHIMHQSGDKEYLTHLFQTSYIYFGCLFFFYYKNEVIPQNNSKTQFFFSCLKN